MQISYDIQVSFDMESQQILWTISEKTLTKKCNHLLYKTEMSCEWK